MWWRLENGGSINSERVDRVTISNIDPGRYVLMAWDNDLGYQLAGEWADATAAKAAVQRLTNSIDASTLV